MSAPSNPSQASFVCRHCEKPIFVPLGLPPTTAPCPHCGKEVRSPDQSAPPSSAQPGTSAAQNRPKERPAASFVPQASESIAQPKKKSHLPVIIVAFLILLVAAAVTLWLANEWKKEGDSEAGSGTSTAAAAGSKESPEELWLRKGWKNEASKTLHAFMSAKSPQERMKYVIPNEGVMEELEMFYPEGKDDFDNPNTPFESFGHFMGSKEDHDRGIFLMQYRQPAQIDMREYFAPIGSLDAVTKKTDPSMLELAYRIDEDNLSKPIGINAFFKKGDDGLKLDASVFIQGKFRTFKMFTSYPQPGKSKVFRVVVSEFLSHKYRNDKSVRTYRLEDFAYRKDYVNVPVEVNSETGKILSALNWRETGKPRSWRTATVELEWTNEAPSMLKLKRVICWEFLGVGGKIGNTEVPKTEANPATSQ